MVSSESPMPSPISRMTFLAPDPLSALRIASDWSPDWRRAPPLVVRSPLAARVTVFPLPPLSALPPQAASGNTATTASTAATLRYPSTAILGLLTVGIQRGIERHARERVL